MASRTAAGLAECPATMPTNTGAGWVPCPTMLQAVTFEGRQSLAAGIAAHLQTVHGWTLQEAWRAANSRAAE